VILTGPLPSSPALVQSVSVPNLKLSVSNAIRLVADLLALAILWVLAFAASQQIPANGRGSSFLRNLLGRNCTPELLANPLTRRTSSQFLSLLYRVVQMVIDYFRGGAVSLCGMAQRMT
jgi:hypothetical protein